MTTDTDPRELPPLPTCQSRFDHAIGTPLFSADQMRAYALAARDAKVPCIASDPRCPCNDGDTCNYVATKMTPAFEVPHPDAAQLIGIADLMPRLSGADPAMLSNVGHYLRGLSDRVKVLPVARTGPLRVAAEAVSAPVGAVPQCGPTLTECPKCRNDFRKCDLATTPLQEPSIEQQLQNAREDFATMKALTESGAAEIARLTAELQEVRKALQAAEAEKAVWVRRADSSWHTKQDATEAKGVREDADRYRWLRDEANSCPRRAPMVFMAGAHGGEITWMDCLTGTTLDANIDAAMTKEKP